MRPLPRRIRIFNRFLLAIAIFFITMQIGRCISGGKEDFHEEPLTYIQEEGEKEDKIEEKDLKIPQLIAEIPSEKEESKKDFKETIPPIDSTHIKSQKNLFLAQKMDNLLRNFRPDYAIYLAVDPSTNEIIAWGERKEGEIQTKPDFLSRATFPAASLIKTVTVAAALESRMYSLNTEIPLIGASHTLYKNQLRVKENYSGPTISLQDAYARSSNPPMAIVGYKVGARALREAAKRLGYNQNFFGEAPARASYSPPDSGYALAETASGFTQATTLSPLLAAAQVRAILKGKPLEIPHGKGLSPYAPEKAIALSNAKFSDNTYYGLREAMMRSVSHGTARKNISTKYMAKKNYADLQIGGKTGSLDGSDPAGRYEWFAGFARRKDDPNKAIVLVIMQVHKEIRSQPATQVAAMLINYWAHNLREQEKENK